MNKFCTNCGNKIDEKAFACVKCGRIIKNEPKPQGKGLEIASMILGIYSAWCSLCFILTSFGIIENLNFVDAVFFLVSLLLITIIIFIFSITGLTLGIISIKKNKNGFNTSGIILNSISILFLVIYIFIIFI